MKKSQESSSGRSAGEPTRRLVLSPRYRRMALEIEHPGLAATGPFGVDNRRHFAVRIDGPKCGRVLLALARVDRNDFIRETGLL